MKNFLTPLIAIQPRNTSSTSKSPDDIVMTICKDIEFKLKTVHDLDTKNANPDSIFDEKSNIHFHLIFLLNFLIFNNF